MKKSNILLFITLGIFLLTLSSCSSSQTFMVQGEPGTIITNPQNQQIAIIDNSGKVSLKMKRKYGYTHYLQSKAPDSNIFVPFALDYSNHSRAFSRDFEIYGGSFILGAGALACIVAGAMALGGDFSEAGGPTFLGSGLGAMLIGGIICTDGAFKDADAIDYDYDYLKKQKTNNDIIK